MPITSRDIREQLLASSPEFQQLAQEHSRYEAQIEQLSRAEYVNVENLTQEAELKKKRLWVKDQREQLIARTWRTRAAT
jgi:uncharacterized protein YdcH (DUF465 family)